jgi:hypothetical protein
LYTTIHTCFFIIPSDNVNLAVQQKTKTMELKVSGAQFNLKANVLFIVVLLPEEKAGFPP